MLLFLTGELGNPKNYTSDKDMWNLQQGYTYMKATCMSTVVKFDRCLTAGCLKLMSN